MKIKKISCLLLAVATLCSLSACAAKVSGQDAKQTGSQSATQAESQDTQNESGREQSMQTVSGYPSPVPDFKVKDLEGNEVTNDFFAKADLTVVNFWGTFCGPCIGEMPELEKWSEELPDNVQLLGVMMDVTSEEDSTYQDAKKIVAATKVKYTNIIGRIAFQEYLKHMVGVPTTIFVDKDGKLVGEPIIGANVPAYKKFVEDYLNEK